MAWLPSRPPSPSRILSSSTDMPKPTASRPFRTCTLHRSHLTPSMLWQSTPLLSPSKRSANTIRRHPRRWMNAVMASSSTSSTEYSLKTALRRRLLVVLLRTTMMESLTSPFRLPRPDYCAKLVNPYGRSMCTTYTMPSMLIPVPNAPVATIHGLILPSAPAWLSGLAWAWI